jgi:membrane protease subunit (stomatin/prohibitin family)
MARKKIGHVELQWTCPNCNSINPGSEEVCGNCGAPQPQDVQFEQPTNQELITDPDKLAQVEAGPDIHCPYCGTRNPGSAEICKQCGGDLIEGMKRESGRVVGAYTVGPTATITCPHCGEENPETASNCANCGGGLGEEIITEKQSAVVSAPVSKSRIWIIIAVVAILVLACGAFLFFSTRTNPTTGVVENVNWERSVPVEALVPVEYKDWEDEIPAGAVIETCSEEVRNVQSESAPNSVEVCGTPYTVDTGDGFAEVVQDCEYEVYATFCNFTVEEWSVVDTSVLTGDDYSPIWPEPILETGQRIGEEQGETYKIIFRSDDKTFVYSTEDLNLFQAAQIGSKWTLNINTFGSLVSIEQ